MPVPTDTLFPGPGLRLAPWIFQGCLPWTRSSSSWQLERIQCRTCVDQVHTQLSQWPRYNPLLPCSNHKQTHSSLCWLHGSACASRLPLAFFICNAETVDVPGVGWLKQDSGLALLLHSEPLCFLGTCNKRGWRHVPVIFYILNHSLPHLSPSPEREGNGYVLMLDISIYICWCLS